MFHFSKLLCICKFRWNKFDVQLVVSVQDECLSNLLTYFPQPLPRPRPPLPRPPRPLPLPRPRLPKKIGSALLFLRVSIESSRLKVSWALRSIKSNFSLSKRSVENLLSPTRGYPPEKASTPLIPPLASSYTNPINTERAIAYWGNI